MGTTIVLPLAATIIQLIGSPRADALMAAGSWFGSKLLVLAGIQHLTKSGKSARE